MIELDIGKILLDILEQYGIVGFSLVLFYFYLRTIDSKLDKLLNLNNKTFGVMLAIVDKNQRATLSNKGVEDD